jgi:hypothetical protein
MSRIPKDPARERRIDNEAIVDTYGKEERAMGWYCYLEGKLRFPFRARCVDEKRTSPLQVGEEVEAVAMPGEDEFSSAAPIIVRWCGRELGVPLAQLEAVDAEPETEEAVGDWHYWVARGYQF